MPDKAEPVASFAYFHNVTTNYVADSSYAKASDGLHIVQSEPTKALSVEPDEATMAEMAGENVRAFLEKRKPSPWHKPEAEQSKPHQHIVFAQPPSTEES